MASLDHVHWHRRQPLRNPMLVAAFEGWNDAGDAASTAVRHLRDVWELELVAELDPEEFYSFTDTRPHVTFDDGGLRRIDWPANRFWAGEIRGQDRDLLVLDGIEPNLRWRTYGEQITGVAHELGVSLVVTLGALLTDIPHTRPTSVIGTADDAELITRLDLRPSGYEGPTGIVGVFQDACTQADMPAVSFWAAVPHYVAAPPCPKATLALLGQLEDLLEVSIPLSDLPEEARAWERGVDELAEEDEEIRDYVRALEETRDTADLPEATGEAIAREFERYLKRRETDDG